MNLLKCIFFSVALIKLLKGYYIKKMVPFSCPLCALELVVKELYCRVCYSIDGYVRSVRFTSNSAKTQQKSSLETITLFIPLLCKKMTRKVQVRGCTGDN